MWLNEKLADLTAQITQMHIRSTNLMTSTSLCKVVFRCMYDYTIRAAERDLVRLSEITSISSAE